MSAPLEPVDDPQVIAVVGRAIVAEARLAAVRAHGRDRVAVTAAR